MNKIILTTLIIVGSVISTYSQSGQKWATDGNSIANGDFIGSTNNFPLDFKTNNVLRMSLGTNGVLKLTALAGSNTRLLQVDASGNLIALPLGTSNQYLSGNGTWVNIPTITSSWLQSGSSIYTLNNKVGIGTSNPFVALDVIGDARISNNLYVGGGIVITDKVNATTEVKGWDIKVDNDLSVESSARLKGPTRIDQGFTFDGVNGMRFFPATSTRGAVYQLGGPTASPLSIANCIMPSTNAMPQLINQGAYISTVPLGSGTGLTNSSVIFQSAPWDGSGMIEVSGVDNLGTENNGLLINYYCGRSTNINTGWNINSNPEVNGGRVNMGAEVEMTRSLKIGWNGTPSIIDPTTAIEINQNKPNSNGVKVKTYTADIKAFSIEYTDGTNGFVVYGDGKTQIGTRKLTSGSHTDAKLTVDGKIVSTSCYVTQSNWADFVFSKDYKLPTLSEIENYYKENKHLPQIPSEKEIKENGVDLGEMNKLLLQKIEELTILMVEQDKRIKQLETKK